MDIESAKKVMLRTHAAALDHGERASGLCLESAPGIGKTEGAFQYAELLAAHIRKPVGIVQFMLATISSVDVRGFMLPVKGTNGAAMDTVFSTPPWYPVKANTFVVEPDGTWHKPGTWEGELPEVGVLFLDEFGQAEDEVKKPAAELVYRGNVGNCELPVGWRVIAAQNRVTDRSGVMRELMFIVNRRAKITIDARLDTWLEWANRQPDHKRPHYLTISFAQRNPDLVFRESVPEGTDPFCTARTLCLMDKDLKAMRSDEDIAKDRLPLDDIAREVAAGWVGGGTAAQFYTHLRYADELPDIDDVEKKPTEAKMPSGRDAQMVCAYMLAHHVGEKNATPILKYLQRMQVEMQVLAVKAVNAQPARAKHLFAANGYSDWLKKNKDLLIASAS